jgi:HK97 family phage prohead protease
VSKTRDLRNLPDPVRERLDGRNLDEITARVRGGAYAEERHPFRDAELRRSDDGEPIIDGYATVYESWYDVLGGPENGYGWREMVSIGAASKSIAERDDVRLLINHDGLPLARTRSGTLSLESDSIGVRAEAALDPKSPTVSDVVSAMEREDLDEMSIAFRAVRQEWNDDYTERIIRELELFDVSLVTYPANPATVAQLRELDASLTPSVVTVPVVTTGASTTWSVEPPPESVAPAAAGLRVDAARAILEAIERR